MEYPWFARMAVLQGAVDLVATISRAGEVEQVRVVSGPEPLATPAKLTLSKWQFMPCNSPKGECTLRFTFLFILEGSCSPSRCPSDFTVDLPDKITVKSKVFNRPLVEGGADPVDRKGR
jgi:hypothetical protein